MGLSVEIFPALEGDSFLISCGENKKTNILIDGGMISTYRNYIRPKLLEIASKGEAIDLLIVTHIDADHIAGILEFIKENGTENNPKIIPIKEIWHNSYRHIQFRAKGNKQVFPPEEEILRSLIRRGIPRTNERLEQLISIEQGSSLASLILKGGFPWNKAFDGQAILGDRSPSYDLSNDIKIKILSPYKIDLETLEKFWFDKLNNMRYGFKFAENEIFDDAFEFLLVQERGRPTKTKEIAKDLEILKLANGIFTEDTRVTNRSSIAIIIEHMDLKLLFLGDAIPSVIKQSLRMLGYDNGQSDFSVVKVAHHGSEFNTDLELLELTKASNYIISSNGAHGHPDLETIARIIVANKMNHKKLLFNYPIPLPDSLLNLDFMSEHNYQIEQFNGIEPITLRF
jgi:beta-lactamase superfamily II metal-dependent hydrolase